MKDIFPSVEYFAEWFTCLSMW